MTEWEGSIGFVKSGGSGVEDDVSGVYIIAEEKDDVFTAKYVGQGESVKERISDHENDSESNKDLLEFFQEKKYTGLRYFFLEVNDKDDRNNLEHTLFNYYGGSDNLYNENEPTGEEIETTYPF